MTANRTKPGADERNATRPRPPALGPRRAAGNAAGVTDSAERRGTGSAGSAGPGTIGPWPGGGAPGSPGGAGTAAAGCGSRWPASIAASNSSSSESVGSFTAVVVSCGGMAPAAPIAPPP